MPPSARAAVRVCRLFRGAVALGLALGLAACDLTGTAAPPPATRTPQPPPALSPIASAPSGTPAAGSPAAGTPGAGTPGAGTPRPGTPGAPTTGPGTPGTQTPAAGTNPDRTATPAPGTTPQPGSTASAAPTAPGGATATAATGGGAQATGQPSAAAGTLQLVSHRGSVQGDEYVVSGEVRNNTAFSPATVRVAGTVYDADGRALDTAEAALAGDGPFRPGEQRAFTLRFRADPRIVRYYIDIEVR